MVRWLPCCVMLLVCGTSVREALADEPADVPATRIEFRWLEAKPIAGVTFDEGIHTTCGPELSYPHAMPVLTQIDVARTVFQEVVFTNGLPSPQYMVTLHLTDAAKQKLMDSCPGEPGQLAVFVNDDYLGTRYFRAAEVDEFVPSAGFTASRSYALRIVSAVEDARAANDAAPQ